MEGQLDLIQGHGWETGWVGLKVRLKEEGGGVGKKGCIFGNVLLQALVSKSPLLPTPGVR